MRDSEWMREWYKQEHRPLTLNLFYWWQHANIYKYKTVSFEFSFHRDRSEQLLFSDLRPLQYIQIRKITEQVKRKKYHRKCIFQFPITNRRDAADSGVSHWRFCCAYVVPSGFFRTVNWYSDHALFLLRIDFLCIDSDVCACVSPQIRHHSEHGHGHKIWCLFLFHYTALSSAPILVAHWDGWLNGKYFATDLWRVRVFMWVDVAGKCLTTNSHAYETTHSELFVFIFVPQAAVVCHRCRLFSLT